MADLLHGDGHALPKTNHPHKSKYFFRFILLDFYLLISTLGIWLTIWNALDRNEIEIIFLVIVALIFIIFPYVYIRKELLVLSKKENLTVEIVKYVEDFHFLCAEIKCGRCRGFFISFIIVFGSIFTNTFFWYSLVIRLDPSNAILIAIPLLLISTPVPGIIGRVKPQSIIIQKLDNFIIKFILGITTGVSSGLIGGYIVYILNVYPNV